MAATYPFHEEATASLACSPATAFDWLDDHRRLSSHMDSSSLMMAGSSMHIEVDEHGGRSVGSRIRLAGRVLGLRLSVEEVVTERTPPWRKAWETVGTPRLLVIGPYRMGFAVATEAVATRVTIWIDYAAASSILGRLAGRAYARWCTARMLRDASAGLSRS